MKLERNDWALLLRHLDTALDLPEDARVAWLDALALEPPRLKAALRQMLADRALIETDDFLAAGARVENLPALHPPSDGQLGPWRLLRELGRGGMATVWLARREDGAHQREVALKLPHPWVGSQTVLERFRRERRILSTLQHPNIAQVLDAGESDGQPWLALEYVEGSPITRYAAARQLPLAERLRLFLPVLRAVQHAHGQLVIHCDIKPANVLVDGAGNVKLLDFGVAKLLDGDGLGPDTALTRQGGHALTPQYASPEQLEGRPLGVTSDVYALGLLLYELLTGRLPYELKRASPGALAQAVLSAQVPRPSVAAGDRALRGDVDTVVMKALKHDSAQRYASAEALAQDIERHLASRPILARPAALGYRLRKLWGRRKLPMLAGTTVSLALLAGGAVALWQAQRAERAARSAQASNDFLIGLFSATDVRENSPEAAARLTARELMERGEQRLATELADAPEARARLLGVLAEVQGGMGQNERAAQLLSQSASLWSQLPGHAVEQAEALQLLSARSLTLDRDADAEAQARAGLAALAGQRGQASDRARGNLQVRLGDVLFRRLPERAAAEQAYRDAIRLLGAHPVKADEYPAALNGLAWVLMERGELAEATALLQTMRAERVRRWGEDSVMVTLVDRDLAQMQRAAGQLVEAERSTRRALQAYERLADPNNEDALTTRFGLATILLDQGRWADALPLLLASEQAFAARGDGSFLYRASSAAAAAECLIELGRAGEARRWMDGALHALGDKAPAGHGIVLHAQAVQARLLTLEGRFAEAHTLFNRLHAARAQDPPARSRARAMLLLRHAELELRRGDAAAATRRLDEAQAAIQPASPAYRAVLAQIAARRAGVASQPSF